MKKLNALPGLLIMLLSIGSLYSQQWTGNLNTFDPIYRSGNVGIGTSTFPADKLQVSGGNIMLDNAIGGTVGNIFFGGKTDLMQNGMRFSFLPTGVVAGGFIDVRTANPGEGLKFRIDNNNGGTERMRITAQGRVGIGTSAPGYLLEVNGTGRFATSLVVNGGALVGATTTSSASSGYALATWSSSVSGGGGYLEGLNTGSYGIAGIHTTGGPNPVEAIGLWGIGGPLGTNKGVGVHGDGQGSFYSVGVWGQAIGGVNNYGIWGDVPSGSGYAGFFSGDVYCTGSYLPSDRNLKKNIEGINNALATINKLSSYTYEYNTEKYPHLNFPAQRQYGFLSQEVEQVLPELIKTTVQPDQYDNEGNLLHESVSFKAINYTAIIPLLVEGMKEQQKEIEALKSQVQQLQQLQQGNETHVELNNMARLEQNSPNPFSESATISYYLPEKATDAAITIVDMKGTVVKTIPLQQKGEGRIVLQARELNAGVYTYYMTVDGITVNSYKMILTE